jgi:lysophospholipase L1-like esterase
MERHERVKSGVLIWGGRTLMMSKNLPRIGMALLLCPLMMPGREQQEFTVTEQEIFFSPYNTFSDGSGQMLSNNVRAGSSYALWTHAGSYLKVAFTGSSIALALDTSSIVEGEMPRVRWSLDDRPMETQQLTRGTSSLTLGSHLNGSEHSLVFYLASISINYDRWKQPAEAVKITGVQLDRGARLIAAFGPIQIAPKRVIFYGDSITEGAWTLGDSFTHRDGKYPDWVDRSDATYAWPALLAAALDAEYGNCGSGGMSWMRPMKPFRPPFVESWNFYFAGRPRLIDGRLSPVPDYVVVNMGTNDGDRDTTTAAVQSLHAIGQAVDGRTTIFVLVPFGHQNRASLEKAMELVGNAQVKLIDLGLKWSWGLNHYGQASLVSFDGLHPSAEASGLFAAALALEIQKQMRSTH